jgi:inhibitor of KinA
MKIKPIGDQGFLVEFEQEISPIIHSKIIYLYRTLKASKLSNQLELVPSYSSLLVLFHPFLVSYKKLEKQIYQSMKDYRNEEKQQGQLFHIPVCYEADFGQDMETVCKHTGYTREEIIGLHTAPQYLIYMLGFLPGFPYLGGLDKTLNTPRLANPRTKIPAGSVGIGGAQTGIYPLESPGGWQLIGRTPVKTYDANRYDPILFKAGDSISFVSITKQEFERLEELQIKGENVAMICQEEYGSGR